MNDKRYFKLEVTRSALYPFIFITIALILVLLDFDMGIFTQENLPVYFGVAIISAIATLLMYITQWLMRKKRC